MLNGEEKDLTPKEQLEEAHVEIRHEVPTLTKPAQTSTDKLTKTEPTLKDDGNQYTSPNHH